MILSAISWAAVYFIVWWTTLFVVLPFGARGRTQSESADVAPGTEGAAPERAPMARLFLATTVVATLVFVVVYAVVTYRLVSLDSIPFLPRFDPAR